jgi:hypothetical protein
MPSDITVNKLKNLSSKERANCSGSIRENQSVNIDLILTVGEIDKFINRRHPHIFEKADKLLLHFDKHAIYAGEWLDYSEKQEELMGVSWTIQSDGADPYRELGYLFRNYLWKTKRFLEIPKEEAARANSNPDGFCKFSEFRISPLGHEYIQTLKQAVINSNQGFCAMWFGGEHQEEKYSQLWGGAIEPAIRKAGYNGKRIDKKEHINDINDEMLMEIRRSKFMVCDFNNQCNGVYFEAGFAMGLNIPVVWTCEEVELTSLHFDINHYNFLSWKDDELDVFCKKLQRRIEAILGRGRNPIIN